MYSKMLNKNASVWQRNYQNQSEKINYKENKLVSALFEVEGVKGLAGHVLGTKKGGGRRKEVRVDGVRVGFRRGCSAGLRRIAMARRRLRRRRESWI